MNQLAQFLREAATQKVGGKAIFLPGLYDPASSQTWTNWQNPRPLAPDEFQSAEINLNCKLPPSYKLFLETLGPGCFADAYFPAPTTLYAYDEALGEMCGFIPLAFNVNGCGDDIAFSPLHFENIFFCCHDPFGYATVAISFEQYLREIAQSKLNGIDMREFYASLNPFTEVQPQGLQTGAKRWWEFWK